MRVRFSTDGDKSRKDGRRLWWKRKEGSAKSRSMNSREIYIPASVLGRSEMARKSGGISLTLRKRNINVSVSETDWCANFEQNEVCKVPLVLIEVQTGSYLGEDDIVRYEDMYKRV